MADYIEPKKRRKRIKVNVFQRETKCPLGYHWERAHWARNRLGVGSHWERRQCVKDSKGPGMKVIKQITRTEGGIPHLFKRQQEIWEEPIDERSEIERVEKDDSH